MKSVKENLLRFVKMDDYYPFLVVHMGTMILLKETQKESTAKD